MKILRFVFIGFALLPLTSLIGCGDGKVASVSGTVTLDNKPLNKAQITFRPVGKGRPSTGFTDENGYYYLQYTTKQNGAEIGEHTVSITTGVEGDGGEIKDIPETVPAKYNSETTLKKEVTSGSNTIDFDLTSK